MTNRAILRPAASFPSLFEDFFKPLDNWLDYRGLMGKVATVPAVNIVENPMDFKVSLAVPGLTKDEFKIDVQNDLIIISVEKEESMEEKEEKFTRREYNYSSFSRSFTLTENVKQDAIEAKYENGVLTLVLPKKEVDKTTTVTRQIEIH